MPGTGASPYFLSQAINDANAIYQSRSPATNPSASCTDIEIDVDGTGGFVNAEPAQLPQLKCPGITIVGKGDATYGGHISGASSAAYGCGLNAVSPANIDSIEIEGFSYGGSTVALCGSFGTIIHSSIHGNDVGLRGSVDSFVANKVWANTAYGIDVTARSIIGGSSPSAGNAIHGNGTGVAVEAGASAEIGFNYIGTPDGITGDANGTGITLLGNASTVHDNLVSGNSGTGIDVEDAGGSSISTNTIGLNASGTGVLGNGTAIFASAGVTIESNVISGNTYGIRSSSGATLVNKNIIGLDASGTNAVYNSVTGVEITGSGATITGNTIAGVQYPIQLHFAGGGHIGGNFIGVTSAGTRLPPAEMVQYDGISVRCSNSVTIDGSNIIGGMSSSGITLFESSGNTISGNYIGVGTDGKTSLNNSGAGILIAGGNCAARLSAAKRATTKPTAARTTAAGGNTINSNTIASNGRSGILIGSGSVSSGNQIAGNTITGNGSLGTGSGVSIQDNASLGNSILDNTIYNNTPKNIDLNTVDPTLPLQNDGGDVDTGPNDGLNYPEMVQVQQDGTNTYIDYSLNMPTGPGVYHVQFFANASPVPGGQVLVGSADATGNGRQSQAVFSGTFDNISATATVTSPIAGTTAGDTSEFSPVIATTKIGALAITPPNFNFGNIEVGATSATSTTFTLQSIGLAAYDLHTFLTTGVCGDISSVPLNCGGSGFICTTDCVYDSGMAPGTACTMTASFAPQTLGPSNLTIKLCPINAFEQQIQLSGNATSPPPVIVSPSGQNFGNVALGTSSAAQTFTITNPAQTQVSLSAVTATPPFSVASTTCGATLAPASAPPANTCTANVVFTPASVGVGSGQLNASFTDPAAGISTPVPVGAALAGVGVAAVQLSLPPSVNVGTYVIGLAPATATATATNTGKTPVSINGISASAPFTATSDCGISLASNASCTITIALASTTVGPVTGNVTVATPAGNQLIALAGLVAPPAIKLVPAQVDFGQVLVNKSATRDIVATNTTGLTVPLGAPAVSTPFTISSSTCGPIVGANGICTITVGFAPQRGGPASGVLTLDFGVNAGMVAAAAPIKRGAKAATNGATAIATVTGNGIDAAALDMPSLIEFGTYIIGAAPIVRTATITNSGNAVVTFQEITASGPFGLTSDCPLNLPPETSCTLTITFNSSTLGAAAGLVTIRSNAIGGLRTISLGALTQLKPVPIVDVKPSTISFGDRLIGTQSPTVTVTVGNSGGADAILGPLTVSSDYVLVSSTCGGTLAMQSTCTADVAMRPIGLGSRPGSLSFTSNAAGSPHIVGLGGNGCLPPSAAANRGTSGDSCGP